MRFAQLTSFMPENTDNMIVRVFILFRMILNYVGVHVFLSQNCHASPFNIKFASDKIYTFNRTKKLYQ